MKNFNIEANNIKDELIEIRRTLHQYPELGFEETNTSKFIKKYNKYIPENECYHLKHKWVEKTDTWHVLDYLERLDDIKDEKSSRWVFGIKPFFKDLIRFKFRDALFHLDRIYEGSIKIKLLK